ncbi:unnamed protein product [Pseudo-nitzschia multistriata]|uniref:Uncharacterized protein n=1 Tax=Pseudo-nitzschia multistriata TaxID=183589 RepID=A0A448ZCA9_9STRA|nr:unnamed protein product [Pseudo-nitzschia multistriata]
METTAKPVEEDCHPKRGTTKQAEVPGAAAEAAFSPARDNRGPRREALCWRCLLFRNLPKGFLGGRDLVEECLPERIRRMVYCESSMDSIMVEFETVDDRRRLLDKQRRKQKAMANAKKGALPEGSPPRRNAPKKPLEFHIGVLAERCKSELFVTKRFGVSAAPLPAQGSESEGTEAPRPVSLAKRCLLVRRLVDPGEGTGRGPIEIPDSGSYLGPKDQGGRRKSGGNPPPSVSKPMEIRAGAHRERVVRWALKPHAKGSSPPVVLELESEESVERIVSELEARTGTGGESEVAAAVLAVPVWILPVRSETHARFCFRGVQSLSGTRGAKPVGDGGRNSPAAETHSTRQQASRSFAERSPQRHEPPAPTTPATPQQLQRVTPGASAEGSDEEPSGKEQEDREEQRQQEEKQELANLEKKEQQDREEKLQEEQKQKLADLEKKEQQDREEKLQQEQTQKFVALEEEVRALREEKDRLQGQQRAEGRLDKLQSEHSDLLREHRGLLEKVERSMADLRRVTEERDAIRSVYDRSRAAWESRFELLMEARRKQAAAGAGNPGGCAPVCPECETFEFYSGLAAALAGDDDREGGEAPGQAVHPSESHKQDPGETTEPGNPEMENEIENIASMINGMTLSPCEPAESANPVKTESEPQADNQIENEPRQSMDGTNC